MFRYLLFIFQLQAQETAFDPARFIAQLSTKPVALQETLETALSANSDIRVEKLNVDIAKEEIDKAKSLFSPNLGALANTKTTKTPVTTAIAEPGALTTETQETELRASKKFITGTTARVVGVVTKTQSDPIAPGLNPSYSGQLNLTVSQPLLRGAGLFVNRSPVVLAKNDAKGSEAKFRQIVMNTIQAAENAYWDLYLQWQNLMAQQKSLESAEKLAAMNRRLVELKVLARLDLTETEKDVASRQESVWKALQQVILADAGFKTLLNAEEPTSGETSILTPSEEPKFIDAKFVLEDEIEQALLKRQDFLAAKLNVENYNIRVKVAKNALLPALSLQGTVGSNSLAGQSRFLFDANGNPVLGLFDGKLEDSIQELFSKRYYQWNAGVLIEFPLGFLEANADLKQKQSAAAQALTQLVRLERNIIREVRTALKLIEINKKRVQAAREAAALAEQQLKDGERQLQLGTTNTTRVLIFLDALTTARLQENDALVAYVKALTDLERATGAILDARGITLSP